MSNLTPAQLAYWTAAVRLAGRVLGHPGVDKDLQREFMEAEGACIREALKGTRWELKEEEAK